MKNKEFPIGKLSEVLWSKIPEGKYKRVYSRAPFDIKPIQNSMFNDPTGYWQKIADNVKKEKGEYPDWWQKLIDERNENNRLLQRETQTD